ncbi:MBL fold metallo-hydrolase [Streptomyces sp. HUAS TT20]|uniref:MBL fold metallo-hydrolase n=1 Tax=Streptomyces sp. HUAS TT20 TaxID=3447509 RepID=UPI0021DB0CB4|nr:MBL fold metallo-hydrolase [Streptomyces sp. HUAS 15-9]UXY32126.1 MBL fold metallo-hydrolase [Streptomyces sp. HUAS 15-9]
MSSLPRTPASPDIAPRWNVGDAVVHRVDELILPPETGPWLIPAATPDLVTQIPWLTPDFADRQGALHLAVHSFAVETGGLRVLVDTGIGNGKSRSNPAWDNLDTPYLDRLTAAGFPPESVDVVILTHLHTDHVGWNTRPTGRGGWEPTFPRARYLVSRAEADYWSSADIDDSRRQMLSDSVDPVRDSGRLELIDVPADGANVAPGLRLLPTPGHTPGQVAVHLRSAGHSAVITGDCIHHPVQMARPALCSSVDVDPEQAARTRRGLLARLADSDTLLLGSHFAPPTAGFVRSEGDSGTYRLSPVPGERPGTV